MGNYTLWTKHGEPGVVMQDGEEDDYNIADWAHLYEAGAIEDEPIDDLKKWTRLEKMHLKTNHLTN